MVVPREVPLSLIHLENMVRLILGGGIVAPAVLSFYQHPRSLDDVIDHLIGKILMLFGLTTDRFHPWTGGSP